ncbi:hypothetical protein [Stieleria mannarensis]|uniref:hypothetical protein n=1 Tax=Stieleria mannarensis TaxID=2755585 RepID=UPI0016012B96|nr:hypothetical protein [Rhodopirellula sp. JC639]
MLCLLSLAGLASAEAQETDLTGRVYSLIADYQLNCEDLRSQPWAFVGKGKSVRLRKGEVMPQDHWYVGCEQGGKSLFASSQTYTSSTGDYREGWNQRFESKRGVLLRTRIYSDKPATVLKELEEDEKKETLRAISRIDPFDQVFGTASSLRTGGKSRRNNWEMLLSDTCELVEGKYDEDGNVVAFFKLDWNYPGTMTITFGKKSDFLPIDVKQTVTVPGNREIPLSHQLIEWKQKRKIKVPSHLKAISNQPSGLSQTFNIDFDWRLGKEIPAKIIDSEMPDWREKRRILFDVDWQRRGVTPLDLIPDPNTRG